MSEKTLRPHLPARNYKHIYRAAYLFQEAHRPPATACGLEEYASHCQRVKEDMSAVIRENGCDPLLVELLAAACDEIEREERKRGLDR